MLATLKSSLYIVFISYFSRKHYLNKSWKKSLLLSRSKACQVKENLVNYIHSYLSLKRSLYALQEFNLPSQTFRFKV